MKKQCYIFDKSCEFWSPDEDDSLGGLGGECEAVFIEQCPHGEYGSKEMTRTDIALKLIESAKPTTFGQFAKLFWPNSCMHTNVTNCGNGARRGAGAFLCAGSFLSRLRSKGLIYIDRDKDNLTPIATLTDKGQELLRKKMTRTDIALEEGI